MKWRRAASESLKGDQVHLWKISLKADNIDIQEYFGLLSRAEKDQTTKFYFIEDRNRFIIRRGVLRVLLSRYLNNSPEFIIFELGEFNKPQLAIAGNDAKINFNLSFSKNLALIGVTLAKNIGVDIEFMENKKDLEAISKRYFSTGEIQELSRLPKDKFLEGFYNCWTRKEAFIKGVGQGLQFPLDKFVVSLIPGEPTRLLQVEDNLQEPSKWTIVSIFPASGFAAAVAVEGKDFEVEFLEFQS